MHCFESELTRIALHTLAREVDPELERDELALEDLLEAHDVHGLSALLALPEERLAQLVRGLTRGIAMAA